MKESLRRAIARRDWLEREEPGFAKVSIMNLYGQPIGKKVCVRSLRRANRQWMDFWKGHDGSDTPKSVYKKNSSNRIARSVRQIDRAINGRRRKSR